MAGYQDPYPVTSTGWRFLIIFLTTAWERNSDEALQIMNEEIARKLSDHSISINHERWKTEFPFFLEKTLQKTFIWRDTVYAAQKCRKKIVTGLLDILSSFKKFLWYWYYSCFKNSISVIHFLILNTFIAYFCICNLFNYEYTRTICVLVLKEGPPTWH